MKRLGQNGWIPPENVSPAAIERAWSQLQRAEHEHEINIRNQLKEQEKLENLAYKFESKVIWKIISFVQNFQIFKNDIN